MEAAHRRRWELDAKAHADEKSSHRRGERCSRTGLPIGPAVIRNRRAREKQKLMAAAGCITLQGYTSLCEPLMDKIDAICSVVDNFDLQASHLRHFYATLVCCF